MIAVLLASLSYIEGVVSIDNDVPIQRFQRLIQKRVTSDSLGKLPTKKQNNLRFSDIIKVFEVDAYFKGKWSTNETATTGSIFNGFTNRNGESILYFEVDNLETRVTTIIAYFKDEVDTE